MAQYSVIEVRHYEAIVEADSPEDAMEKAREDPRLFEYACVNERRVNPI